MTTENPRENLYNLNRSISEPVQWAWQLDSLACGRVASDFGIPIMCVTLGLPIVNQGVDYMSFEKCCPQVSEGGINNGSNVWVTRTDCKQHYCYTHDQNLRAKWSKCINETTWASIRKAEKEGNLAHNVSDYERWNPQGRCEEIDYTNLEKGIYKYKNGAAEYQSVSVKTMVGLVGVGLFLFGGGMF